jgi:hypothetical protein
MSRCGLVSTAGVDACPVPGCTFKEFGDGDSGLKKFPPDGIIARGIDV